jgi:hypothetical protein
MKIFLITIVILLVLWSLYGYFSSRVERAEYSVIKKMNGYEIRNYPAHIVAQTTVDGSYQESMSKGFSIVAGYIFGGNLKKENISMTSPVLIQDKISAKIAMTAPVIVSNNEGSKVISFGMPKSYTLDTLPTPKDPRVKLVEVPNKRFAALRFTGYRNKESIQEMEKRLLEVLLIDKVEIVGAPSYAGYNAPGTPPWMMRNEVMVEIR